MSFPRYPAYKDSGVEWLGEVPEHWEVLPIKRIASLQSGTGITADSITDEGPFPVYGGNGVRGYTDANTHEGHFPIIGRQGALCGNINYAKGGFWASEHAVVVTPCKQVEVHWLGETLRAMNLNQYSVSAAQPGLSVEAIVNLFIPWPPRDEQRTISTFLDHETAKIEALIAEQQHLIELLQEKRQAVISHAVTKGLNPDAPMKDSGVEWLGEVPEHWTLKRLKHLSPNLTVGIVVNPSEYVSDEGLPFIYGGDIREGVIDWENSRRIAPALSDKQAKTRLRSGDLLMVRVGAPGITAVVPAECEGGNCASVMLIRQGSFSSQWLCFTLNTRIVRFQVEVVQYGAAQEQFNISHAVNFWLPVPPRQEQDRIATFLLSEHEKAQGLILQAQNAVSLLQERRSALISAAVTGQIDVRGLVPEASAA
jgi:type I restriction enzyme S subunit